MSGPRQHWTITEAVERTTASRSTIRRYRVDEKLPNAYKDSNGTWKYPMEDFVALGILVTNTPVEAEHPEHPSGPLYIQGEPESEHLPLNTLNTLDGQLAKRDQQIIELERELAVERERTAGLRLQIEELRRSTREAIDISQAHAKDMAMALRMIQPAKVEHPEPHSVNTVDTQPEHRSEQTVTTPEHPPKKRWFGRR